MTTDHNIADLDERSLILALQEVTENLMAATGSESLPKDRDEAHDLLAALLRAGGIDDAAELAPLDESGQYAAARRVLVELARDPATRAVAEPVLADPPADTRLGAELVVPSLATMAGLLTWLQTKVDVRIKRKDGKTEFEFRVMKDVAPAAMLKELAAAVARLWNGSPPQ